ncbi:MAG: hypothetical protein ABF242_09640 [Flavobacteriales bacterium]
MKNTFFVILLFSFFTNCKEEKKLISNVNSNLSVSNIETSLFDINCNKDTIIIGEKGTRITLTENTFVNSTGELISGNIQLELKECLVIEDIVLANLHTVSDGEILESGGMIYLNATQNGENLEIATDKQIGIEVLSDSSLQGMSYYEGEILADSTLNWKNPVKINSNIPKEITETVTDSVKRSEISGKNTLKHNIAYSIQEFGDSNWIEEVPKKLKDKIGQTIWREISTISKDSMVIIDGYHINLYKLDTFNYWNEYTYEDIWVPIESVNTYLEDPNTNYIFSVKKLGWANIDRLYQDERTKKVEFITEVQDYVKFDKIFISMIFKDKNIFLPGYQRMDKTFGFSHGDFEDMNLPIGETVQILATSNQDGESFYSLESAVIDERTTVKLNMTRINKNELKQVLMDKL